MLFYFSYLRSEDNSAVNPEEKTVHQVRGDLIYPIGIESGRIVRMDFDMNVCLNFSFARITLENVVWLKVAWGSPLC